MDFVYNIKPPSNFSDNLGQLCQSLRVDNNTSQWLYVPQANQFVAPYTLGRRFTIQGTQSATAQWITPDSVTPFQLVPGQICTLTYSTSPGQTDPGFQTQVPTVQPMSLLYSIDEATGVEFPAKSNGLVQLPSGAMSLLCWTTVGGPSGMGVNIQGVQSGIQILPTKILQVGFQDRIYCPVIVGIDSQVQINTGTIATGGKLYVACLYSPTVIQTDNVPPISVLREPIVFGATVAAGATTTLVSVGINSGLTSNQLSKIRGFTLYGINIAAPATPSNIVLQFKGRTTHNLLPIDAWVIAIANQIHEINKEYVMSFDLSNAYAPPDAFADLQLVNSSSVSVSVAGVLEVTNPIL